VGFKGVTLKWTPTDENVVAGALQEFSPPEVFADFEAGNATQSLDAGHSQVKTPSAGAHPLRFLTVHSPLLDADSK
jgi:hypothetical protein